MAILLPPIPYGSPPGSSFWNDWYEKLRNLINEGTVTVLWSSINFSGSNLTDIVNRAHNNLQSLQGGVAGEYYHLTSAQQAGLTGGGDSTLHFHSSDRARANHTGTQNLSTIGDVTITAANLNSLDDGVDSALHFHASDRARASHTGTQDHNTTLSGFQGGSASERYHLTQTQHTRATSFISAAADPTTTDIAAGEWAMYKNTTSGTLKLWANDGGTMKSVTLT